MNVYRRKISKEHQQSNRLLRLLTAILVRTRRRAKRVRKTENIQSDEKLIKNLLIIKE